MMANKYVDKCVYPFFISLKGLLTLCQSNMCMSKTWSDVSGILLKEIDEIECEILLGIDFPLYVNQTTYKSYRGKSRQSISRPHTHMRRESSDD